jgi:hypothetical protein
VAIDKIRHSPSRLYNYDETDIAVVQHKCTKGLGLKEKRQIGAHRGGVIIVVTCVSPAAHFVPPLVIFPKKYETRTNE